MAPSGLYRDHGRDGLSEAWVPGPVWCNPPYSHYDLWLHRAAAEGVAVVVVALVPADTSTRVWRCVVAARAAEVRFVTGRLRFLRPDGFEHVTTRGGGGMVGPSAVVVFRPGHYGAPTYSYIDRPGRTRR